MAHKPERVEPGQAVRAEHINALVDWVTGRTDIRAGPGVQITHTDKAVIVALAAAFGEIFVPAVITAVAGALPDDLPANVKYSAKPVGYSGGAITNRVPEIGRPIAGARVIRAKIGDPCLIVRTKTAAGDVDVLLWVLTEQTPSFECGAAARDGEGDGFARAEALVAIVKERVLEELRKTI